MSGKRSTVVRSNAVIANGQRLFLPPIVVNAGGSAVNYLDDGEPHLSGDVRSKPLTTFVIHETAGNSATRCKETLEEKHLGVHLILDQQGVISCHADLATEICSHAGQANGISIGMEIVNSYRPEVMRDPHGEVREAQWWTWVPKGASKLYVCPTETQMNVALRLVPWLCDHLGIPTNFPTLLLNAKNPRITGWKNPPLGWRAKPAAGIVAHRDFSSHADGRYILERLAASIG